VASRRRWRQLMRVWYATGEWCALAEGPSSCTPSRFGVLGVSGAEGAGDTPGTPELGSHLSMRRPAVACALSTAVSSTTAGLLPCCGRRADSRFDEAIPGGKAMRSFPDEDFRTGSSRGAHACTAKLQVLLQGL
jgi:hypothetical protein